MPDVALGSVLATRLKPAQQAAAGHVLNSETEWLDSKRGCRRPTPGHTPDWRKQLDIEEQGRDKSRKMCKVSN